MTGMAVLLFVRPILRHRDRFAQGDARGDGWSADEEYLDRAACDTRDDRLAAITRGLTSMPSLITMMARKNRSADMSSITIRNLDPTVKERLRIRAAQHGHSMEAEARSILQSTLKEPERLPARNLYERIRARFEPLGGADDLELPPRLPDRDPPRFD
jgi:plasmid stability protein